MNRKEKIDYINKNILPQIDFMNPCTAKDIAGDAIRLIEKWRIGKPVNVEMHAIVDDGFLYMNGEPLGRIAAKMPKLAFTEYGYYMEGKCINDYDD